MAASPAGAAARWQLGLRCNERPQACDCLLAALTLAWWVRWLMRQPWSACRGAQVGGHVDALSSAGTRQATTGGQPSAI